MTIVNVLEHADDGGSVKVSPRSRCVHLSRIQSLGKCDEDLCAWNFALFRIIGRIGDLVRRFVTAFAQSMGSNQPPGPRITATTAAGQGLTFGWETSDTSLSEQSNGASQLSSSVFNCQ
eukprot:1110720-Amphidinium_carterae.1